MKQSGQTSIPIPADPVWTGDAARRVDQLTIDSFRIPQKQLMANAGEAVANEAKRHGRSFLVLAGPGNNGGDAIIAGEILSGIPGNTVHVMRIPRDEPTFSIVIPDGIECVIDGVLGLGFKGKLNQDSPAAKALRAVAEAGITVVAVDLPSGIACDDAGTTSALLPADVTVTFGGMKAIHAISPARELCGRTTCAEIGFSEAAIKLALAEIPPLYAVVRPQELLGVNPWQALAADAHKYDRGHVLVIGGSPGKTGAPVLAAMASLRSGAGWATVAIPNALSNTTFLPPDLTAESLWGSGRASDRLDHRKVEKFLSSRNVKAVVVGPGTMENPLDQKSLQVLVDFAGSGCVVIDAGALQSILTLLAKTRSSHEGSSRRLILTPHPGEWRRLSEPGERGKSKTETLLPAPLDPQSCNVVAQSCARLGTHLLYKHSTPVLCGPQKFAIDPAGLASTTLVFNKGSNAMGRAGTGDVLTGAIAAHGAIGCAPGFATMRALSLLARATELAAAKVGYHAVLPTDIIHELGRAG